MVMTILGTLIIALPLATITTKAMYFLFGEYISLLPGYELGFPLLSLAICLPFAWPAWGKIWELISGGIFEIGEKLNPLIIDTSAIMDERTVALFQTGIVQSPIHIPHTILDELRHMADAEDKAKRENGRKALDAIGRLKDQHNKLAIPHIKVFRDMGLDFSLVNYAKQTRGKILTLSRNLEKVAHIDGVETINLNDLAKQLTHGPSVGEHATVKIIKPGENRAQGIGYLSNGTMVVVEDAAGDIDTEVSVEITRNIQTHGGTLFFAKKA